MSAATAVPARRRWDLRRFVLLTLVIGSGAVLAISAANTDTTRPTDRLHRAVLEQYPEENTMSIRQVRIGLRLQQGYALDRLEVNGVLIPDDQLQRVDPLNQVFFTPGENTETGILEAGRTCAAATFHQVSGGADTSDTYTWCFQLTA